MAGAELHAHYCPDCRGYSPCLGPAPFRGSCLLTDSCVQRRRVLEDVPPVRVVGLQ
jgi:hypothetical protein